MDFHYKKIYGTSVIIEKPHRLSTFVSSSRLKYDDNRISNSVFDVVIMINVIFDA